MRCWRARAHVRRLARGWRSWPPRARPSIARSPLTSALACFRVQVANYAYVADEEDEKKKDGDPTAAPGGAVHSPGAARAAEEGTGVGEEASPLDGLAGKDYWAALLGERHEDEAAQAFVDMGKGKRTRRQVSLVPPLAHEGARNQRRGFRPCLGKEGPEHGMPGWGQAAPALVGKRVRLLWGTLSHLPWGSLRQGGHEAARQG